MTLKNKDGGVYRLRGPNPLMKNQEIWDTFELHNMKWTGELAQIQIKKNEPPPPSQDDFIKELTENPMPAPQPEPVKPPETKPVVVIQPPNTGLPEGVEASFIYCLPAVLRERQDAIYGDKYRTIQYGSPFSFEGVVVEQEDLTFVIWTNTRIATGSILYPREGQRWWRVQKVKEKTGGWLVTSHPSNEQPIFS